MKLIDDRTEEQKKTHTTLITATDKFMSGWGVLRVVLQNALGLATHHKKQIKYLIG